MKVKRGFSVLIQMLYSSFDIKSCDVDRKFVDICESFEFSTFMNGSKKLCCELKMYKSN